MPAPTPRPRAPLTARRLIGYLLDNADIGLVFLLINVAGVINNALLIPPNCPLTLILSMCCVAVGRQFVYSTFFAQLQRIASPVTYGTLAALANICVAATGLFLSPLSTLSTSTFKPWGLYAFTPANLIMISLVCLLLTQPLACWKERASVATASRTAPPPHSADAEMARGAGASALRVSLLKT